MKRKVVALRLPERRRGVLCCCFVPLPYPRRSACAPDTVLLNLKIENNTKFGRGKKRVKEGLESHLRHQYAAKVRPSGQYELKIPHRSDEDLDRIMEDLLREIAFEADIRNCFSESDARLEGSDRSW